MVRMELLLDDIKLSIAQLGPDFLILEFPCKEHAPCNADIVLEIDCSDRSFTDRFTIHLPKGLIGGERHVIHSAPEYGPVRFDQSAELLPHVAVLPHPDTIRIDYLESLPAWRRTDAISISIVKGIPFRAVIDDFMASEN